mgnify:CR=1 FL=1
MENRITIHRPVLSDEERARRMERIKQAAINLILAADRVEREKEMARTGSPGPVEERA